MERPQVPAEPDLDEAARVRSVGAFEAIERRVDLAAKRIGFRGQDTRLGQHKRRHRRVFEATSAGSTLSAISRPSLRSRAR
jgi:hypothetical protein